MVLTEKIVGVFVPTNENESQAVVISGPNDTKETTERGKRQRKTFQHLLDNPDCSPKNSSWKSQNSSVNKNSEIRAQRFEHFEP